LRRFAEVIFHQFPLCPYALSLFDRKKAAPFYKVLLLGTLFCVAQHASAQTTTNGDVVLPGSNAWMLHTPDDGRTALIITPLTASSTSANWSPPGNNWSFATRFFENGDVRFANRVGIGTDVEPSTTFPAAALTKFAVNGTISARGIRVVAAGAPWPDYVFAPSYTLRPLGEVAQFITQHHHLPDMPSAAEVETQGLDLGAMDARLLRKVEELTLYLLRMQAENEALRARVSALETTSCQ
jgi:hypothetical protein